MPKNEDEIKKYYNYNTNMIFSIKDLINFDDDSRSRLLITLVKCKSNQGAGITTEFFIDIVEFKTLERLIMYNKLKDEWKLFKGSSGEARILTVTSIIENENRYYSFKIDIGKGVKQKDIWKMVKQEKYLIYNLSTYQIMEVFSAVNECIERNRMQYIIEKFKGAK